MHWVYDKIVNKPETIVRFNLLDEDDYNMFTNLALQNHGVYTVLHDLD
jgi:hypothetical protein